MKEKQMPQVEQQVRGNSKGSISFTMIVWLIISLMLIIGPWTLNIRPLSQVIMMAIGFIFLVVIVIIVVVTKLYQKASANTALVRTGAGGIKVILDGGIFFIPVFHKLLKINLETMRLDVVRKGSEALITSDFLRSDLGAQFYIKVQPTEEDIISAARSLGEKSVNEASVKELVFDKLVSALRTVAAKSTLFDLNSEREKFAKEVKEAVEKDLKHNGLTLESVTISSLDQTDVSQLNAANVFDAQGRKRIAEITQAAAVETNRLEREAEQQIKEKDVQTKQQVLNYDLKLQKSEADQSRDVSNAKSEAERQAAEFRIAQEEAVSKREVEKQRAIEAAKIEAAQKLILSQQDKELTEVEKQKAIETANRAKESAIIEAEQKKQVADVNRQTAVEVANREQMIAISLKEKNKAEAEAARLAAEAAKEAEAQKVKTVEIVKTAEREKEKSIIDATAMAEMNFVESQRAADAEAYKVKALAEGKKAAAEAEAFAKIKAAEADKEAAEKRAAGKFAEDIIPVNIKQKEVEIDRAKEMIRVQVNEKQIEVDRKAVEVMDARVAVERKELEQKQEFGKAALEFEIEKLKIAKFAEVQIAAANAMSTFMNKTEMTIFGDPKTLAEMTTSFSSAMGISQSIQGFFAGLDKRTEGGKTVYHTLDSIQNMIQGLSDYLKQKYPIDDNDLEKLTALAVDKLKADNSRER